MKIMSVDFGDARTGIAICDKNEMLASPVCVISEHDFNTCVEKELVSERSKIPYKLWDERSTTVTAHQYLNVTNTRGKKRKAVVDAVASTIILETYLEFRKHHRDECPL